MSDLKLLFDIGNTRLKWALYQADKFIQQGNLLASEITPELLDQTFDDQQRPDSIWISNVGSVVVIEQLSDWVKQNYLLNIQLLEVSQSCCGITNEYKSQDTQGVDRWVAAIGARSVLTEGHLIIVDAGTAVTIDWLSKENRFEGGTILPGYNLMHDSLMKKTAGVSSDFSWAQQIVGRSTQECVNSGVSFGLVGAIERVVKQMTGIIGAPVNLLLTGGSALAIAERSDLDFILQENLVLLGVAAIARGQI